MEPFATLEDISILWRELKESEYSKAEQLLTVVSDSLRYEANKVGKDLDKMIEQNEALRNVAKSVTVDVVARTLMTSTDTEPMTQMSQSALGYSVTGTYLIPGGGLFIKKSELSRLGLRRQRVGVMDIYVLGAPASTTEILDTLNLTGKKAVYNIAIPKGDNHTWQDCRVDFFGMSWQVIGFPQQGIEENIPLEWNQKWQVALYG